MPDKKQLHNKPVRKKFKAPTLPKPMKYVDPKTGKDTDQKPPALQMGHSPAEMGHSPAEMSPYKMESAKQEKYNLMHDNPVAKDASGGRSWMSKHNHKMGGSPIKKHCM